MYIDKKLPEQAATKQHFNIIIHNPVKPDPEHQNSLVVPDLLLSLSPLGLVFIWAIFLFICQKIRSSLDSKIVLQSSISHKVPCKNCQFFSNNHYLKCAVKPDTVLTDAAIDCAEYAPKKKKFPARKLFGD